MQDSAGVDVFISFHSANATAAKSLAAALGDCGIVVHAEPLVNERSEIAQDRVAAVALRAKAFIAWMSSEYCAHTVLQREFMSVFAAAAHGPTRERLFLIDATPAEGNPLPALLRDGCHVESERLTKDGVLRVAAQIKKISGPIAEDLSHSSPANAGNVEFVGRIANLWQIHQTLGNATTHTSATLQLIGAPGVGKTWLADEYAHTFAASYPGGIFRVDAGWFDAPGATEFQLVREQAWRGVAAKLGLDSQANDFAQLRRAVRQHFETCALPYLWIVDHVPAGQTHEAASEWLAPTAHGATLLISRHDDYASLGTTISLSGLDMNDAQALLARHKAIDSEQERTSAHQLIEQLGQHTLSLHLAAVRLGKHSYDRLLLQVAAPAKQAAELADSLVATFDHPQLVAICVTLYRSIGHLSPQARNCLRLAAVLADSPVPIALITTALAQHAKGSAAQAVSQTQIAVDELLNSALAHKSDDAHFVVTPLVRVATLAGERVNELESARALLIDILASELPQSPEANRDNPYLPWLAHILHLARSNELNVQLAEVNAWLSRFETLGVLRGANRHAVALLEHSDIDHTEQLLDVEFAARRQGLGDDHPGTVTSVNNLAVVLSMRGEFVRAKSLLEKAVDVRRKSLGEQHPDTLTPLNNLGVVLWHEGDVETARAVFERVVELRRHGLGETHADTLVSMRNLAVVLRGAGEFVAARGLLEHVVEARSASLGSQHADTCTAMASLAQTLREHSDSILSNLSATPTVGTTLLNHEPSSRRPRLTN